jgi:hypothetical protein
MKDNKLVRRPARLAVLALLLAAAAAIIGLAPAQHAPSAQAYLPCAVCI